MKQIYNCALGISNVIAVDNDIEIRTAVVQDMKFFDKLQKENAYAVGFIPKNTVEKYIFGGERNYTMFIAEVNKDPVGYFWVTPGHFVGDYCRCQQIVVRNDARHLEYGTALTKAVERYCEDTGKRGIKLHCRADLEANEFWKALGFEVYDIRLRGSVNHVGMVASNDIFSYKLECNHNMQRLIS